MNDARKKQTTDREIQFIRHLGRGVWRRPVRLDRAELLRRYLQAAGRRADWGEIDPAAVKDYVREQLRRCRF